MKKKSHNFFKANLRGILTGYYPIIQTSHKLKRSVI
jgi:hypothetical protein